MPLSETVLVVTTLLGVAVLAAGLCRRLPVPYTVLLVIIGMGLALGSRSFEALAPLRGFGLTPDLVLFVFLPALVFESALNLDARALMRNLAPVLVLAIPALLASTAIIGVGLALLTGMPLVVALLFGALISATDPVAVVALFRELGVPRRLTVLVEGESLLNDATAIVVVKILLGIALTGALAWGDAGAAAGEFLRVFAGGILAGAALGIAASELTHRLKSDVSALILATFVVAYAGFAAAEHWLHVSGVMAAVSGALAFGVLAITRLAPEVTSQLRETWGFVAAACNALLFLLMGMSVDLAAVFADVGPVAVAVVLMLLARAVGVYALVPATTRLFRLPRVARGEQHIMAWGGLRGGLAIAIVLSMPQDLPGRDLVMHMTLGAVLFTLLVSAPTVRPLIHWLGLDRMTGEERAQLQEGLEDARHEAVAALEAFRAAGLIPDRTHHWVVQRTGEILDADAPRLGARQRLRHAYLESIRTEFQALSDIFRSGALQPYTYLDLRNTLLRDREGRAAEAEGSAAVPQAGSPFERFEAGLLRRLREARWASGLLARYQNFRLAHRLQRDMASVVMSQAVLRMLEGRDDLDPAQRADIEATYRDRMERRRARIGVIRDEFPEFFRRFQMLMFRRVALTGALLSAEEARHAGHLGGKAYSEIRRRIERALAALPPISRALPQPNPADLLAGVALFVGLPEDALQALSRAAVPVSFLPGDVIVAEGQHGDALYVISHGRVRVVRGHGTPARADVAMLEEGDFFGERALLGDHVRGATAIAQVPCTLLRLARPDVLRLAERNPEVARRLSAANQERQRTF